jgi:hypothetical protein
MQAHEDALTKEQVESLRRVVEQLRTTLARGRLTAEKAWEFGFDGFTAHDLEHAPAAPLGVEMSDDVRGALRHVCRAAFHRRSPVGKLARAKDISFLLGSPGVQDWLHAFRLLRREPFSPELDRAVVALGRDERPEVRLIAAKLASSLLVFGREAEGLRATVLACLSDADPNVAAACAVHAALDTRDKRVVDRLVACLGDERLLRADAPAFLRLQGHDRVATTASLVLSWMIYREGCVLQETSQDPRNLEHPEARRKYVAMTPDEIRAWWRANREAFGFEAPAPQWRKAFDEVLVLDVGKPAAVPMDGMPVSVLLKAYRESWSGEGTPVTTVDTRIRSGDWDMGSPGNPDHDDGYVHREIRASGREWQWTAAFLPTHEKGRVRCRLTLHFGFEGRG